jgi:hypothetical protein
MEELLRHFLAVLVYRCSKSIIEAPPNYSDFEPGYGIRTPKQILSHMSRVLRFAHSLFVPSDDLEVETGSWEEEVERFYKIVDALDKSVADGLPDREQIADKLLQGPLSDAMTHVGQLAMIRRMVEAPVPYESYFNAAIEIGHLWEGT